MIWQILSNVFKRHPWAVLALFVLGISIALFEGLGLGLLLPLIEGLGSSGEIRATHPVSRIVENLANLLGLQFSMSVLFVTGLTIFLLQSIMIFMRSVIVAHTRVRVEVEIRTELFASLLGTRLGYFHQKQMGSLTNGIVLEVNRAGVAFQMLIMLLITGALVLSYIVIGFFISWQLSLIALGFVLISGLISRKRSAVRQRGQEISAANTGLESATVEYFSGVREVNALGMEDHANDAFQAEASNVAKQNYSFERLVARFRLLYEVTAVVVTFGLVGIGFSLLSIDVAVLVTFLVLLFRLTPRLILLQDYINKYLGSEPGYTTVQRLMAEADEHRPPPTGTKETATTLRTSIDFKNVTFSYDGRTNALEGVDLSIPQGNTVAIVGASGAGKSTLVDLILRFADPMEGQIFVDGVDLRHMDLKLWRSTIGFVSQDTFLFHDTVRNNLHYGNQKASPQEIEDAARRAGAHEFIVALKEGYDTTLGDRGVTLSGGQRQRLALARAIVRDPQVLILDEATSDLDSRSQHLIRESIRALSGDRTVIIIAHRLSTIEGADRIVVLDKGQVVEAGDHETLMNTGGHYAAFHELEYNRS